MSVSTSAMSALVCWVISLSALHAAATQDLPRRVLDLSQGTDRAGALNLLQLQARVHKLPHARILAGALERRRSPRSSAGATSLLQRTGGEQGPLASAVGAAQGVAEAAHQAADAVQDAPAAADAGAAAAAPVGEAESDTTGSVAGEVAADAPTEEEKKEAAREAAEAASEAAAAAAEAVEHAVANAALAPNGTHDDDGAPLTPAEAAEGVAAVVGGDETDANEPEESAPGAAGATAGTTSAPVALSPAVDDAAERAREAVIAAAKAAKEESGDPKSEEAREAARVTAQSVSSVAAAALDVAEDKLGSADPGDGEGAQVDISPVTAEAKEAEA